jgi:hypothetical protein
MSASIHVVAFKPADDKWRKMKAVFDACRTAGIDPPSEVEKFFNYEIPSDNGVLVDEEDLINLGAAKHWLSDGYDGFEVDVNKLPADVKVIRFYVSY